MFFVEGFPAQRSTAINRLYLQKIVFMKALFSFLLFVTGFVASAQSVGTTVKFNKADRPALMLYLPYSEDVANGTIVSKLKEIGYQPETKGALLWKQDKTDGFYVYKGVVLKDSGGQNQLVDLYFRVDRRGNKRDNQSVIYLLTSKGGENFVTSLSEPSTYAAAQNFLNGFVAQTATYKHGLDVTAQVETVKKAEKKLTDLMNDEQDLNKKIAKLQDDLAKNKQAQANQQATIDGERKKLETLRATKPAM